MKESCPLTFLDSVSAVASRGLELVRHRMQVIKMLQSQAKDLEPEGIEVASKAGFTLLMNLVSELARIGDRSLPNKLLLGLPIVGPADESPFFEPLLVPATASREWTSLAPQNSTVSTTF